MFYLLAAYALLGKHINHIRHSDCPSLLQRAQGLIIQAFVPFVQTIYFLGLSQYHIVSRAAFYIT